MILFGSSEAVLFRPLSYVWIYSHEVLDNSLIPEEEGEEISTTLPLKKSSKQTEHTNHKFILILEYI